MEKTDLEVEPPLPLFALVHGEETAFMCLWQGEDKQEVCGTRCFFFNELLDHIMEHGLNLKNGTDFCQECECIFESPLEGLEHYIVHALAFENNKMVRKFTPMSEENESWLTNIYEKIKEIRKEVLERLLFKFVETGDV